MKQLITMCIRAARTASPDFQALCADALGRIAEVLDVNNEKLNDD